VCYLIEYSILVTISAILQVRKLKLQSINDFPKVKVDSQVTSCLMSQNHCKTSVITKTPWKTEEVIDKEKWAEFFLQRRGQLQAGNTLGLRENRNI
jgi:hypothetical protein